MRRGDRGLPRRVRRARDNSFTLTERLDFRLTCWNTDRLMRQLRRGRPPC